MSEIAKDDPGDPPPTPLDAALRSIPARPVPENLLAACLATVPGPVDRSRLTARRRLFRVARWAAAASVLAASAAYLARPGEADAAHLLQAVKAAWTKVPASHQVIRIARPDGPRTEETWVVRRKGVRKETRSGGDLIAVVVKNARWEFRWDVPGRMVVAWSTDLAPAHQDPRDEGLVLDQEDFEAWAKFHHAAIVVEGDTIGGREVRKVALRWPGEGRATHEGAVWFDSRSLLPVRQRTENSDGTIVESTIDYPAPDAVAGDLFSFAMPRDVVLEVNDPDLGRQLYSEGRPRETDPAPTNHTQGAGR